MPRVSRRLWAAVHSAGRESARVLAAGEGSAHGSDGTCAAVVRRGQERARGLGGVEPGLQGHADEMVVTDPS